MRKKITSLSVLLLSGAFLLTSCVKDEELESTKNLRTAKETREAEKLAEEKAKVAAEQAQAENTLASAKDQRVRTLAELQLSYLREIKNAQDAINKAQDENAAYTAEKSASEADVARKKEDANRKIARLNAEIAALENSVDADYEDLLKQVNLKQAEIEKEENVNAVAKNAFDNAEKALLQPLVEGVLKSDVFKKVYEYVNSGSNYVNYTTVTSPVAGYYYVKNFGDRAFRLYTSSLYDQLTSLPFTVDNTVDYPTYDEVTLYYDTYKTIATKNLNTLDGIILGLTVSPSNEYINTLTEQLNTAIEAHARALTAYNTTPNASTLSALQSAKQEVDRRQNTLDQAKADQTESIANNAKYTAVREALKQANINAVNALINAYNNGLAGLAQKYASYVKSQEKLNVLEAEKTALNTLLAGAKVDGRSVAEKISSLKADVKTQQDIITNADKEYADNNSRLIAINNRLIETNTAIVAAKTAELNYVKAQLAALGVQ
ncbi:hypothetical protein [Capnocytophaga granulosa]|jgi:lipoprotein|uniref:hypothetical protein n=1 Tax=Capnocytophaga granulosa TaxID=45242 RepID=UPI0028EF3DEC|nr:hypothetical protein [Capnocytophaga granulosa]